MKINLTIGELHLGAQIGCLRQIESLARGLPDKHGFSGPGWNNHIEGALGEIVVAKALGIYWGGTVNTFKNIPDVGKLEVRTRSKNDYDLIVRENDDSNSIYVLVTGQAPEFYLVGWIKGHDAKVQKFVQTYGGRPPAYFVPHNALNPIEDLKKHA